MSKIINNGPLLDKSGNLIESGYALSQIKKYNRNDIKANKLRIKEWDYYYLGDDKYGLALTIADNSYMSLCSISFFDYQNKTYEEKMSVHLFSNGKVNLPSSSREGNIIYKDKKVEIHFDVSINKRHLYGSFTNFKKDKTLSFDFNLLESIPDSIVMATPFNKDKHFYYNQKINCLLGAGNIYYGKDVYKIEKACGVLDWGRGVWTYINTWYWASCSFVDNNGNNIGFNLGYGFGSNSESENILFYNDETYKLNDVKFDIPMNNKKYDYLSSWDISSTSGNIKLKFHPLILRKGGANLLIINSKQRQVFGYFDGYFDVGKKIEIKSRLGFAERVYNRW